MATAGKRDTQAEILRATLCMVAEYGFHGISMQMIATQAMVGVGSIYRYFYSKDELIHAVFNKIEENLELAILKGYSEKSSIKERFICLSLNMTSYLLDNPVEFRFMEQYFVSSFGISKGKEMFVVGSYRTKESDGFFKALFKKGQTSRIIKDLPQVTLYALTLGSFTFLVNSSHRGLFLLDKMTIQKTIEESWSAIARN